jgi:hypothetical protein
VAVGKKWQDHRRGNLEVSISLGHLMIYTELSLKNQELDMRKCYDEP